MAPSEPTFGQLENRGGNMMPEPDPFLIAHLERAVVEAAMDLTKTAQEMGVLADLSLQGKYEKAIDLRVYAAKENAVFNACAALDRARKGEE